MIDAQIVNDLLFLHLVHEAKVSKYEVLIPLVEPLRQSNVFFKSFTMYWRSVISPDSEKFLISFRLLRRDAPNSMSWLLRFFCGHPASGGCPVYDF